jgi:outer membrane receptor protein involved in Fe transport
MLDYMLVPSLRFSGGLRVEDAHFHTDIQDYYDKQYTIDDDRRLGVKPGIMDEVNYLRSASIIYNFKSDMTYPVDARINYSQTVARPSLRELTYFNVFDYTLLGYVTGNPDLKSVHIDNYDIRFESYFKSGDNISVSLFYKTFRNHIELIRDVRDYVYFTWQNAGKSDVLGIEVEGKKTLLKNFDFRANITVVNSKTTIVHKRGETWSTDTITHTMYGQAPYIVNGILSYSSEKYNLSCALSYNVQGPKLVITNNYGIPDIFEMPRHMLDFKISKSIGKYFSASLKIRDILNTATRRAYKYSAGWWDFDSYTYGTNYIFGISYNL